jgi:NAD(P)-dependent dehydrogenase (short-subunit alcohol dehydrogenase family)
MEVPVFDSATSQLRFVVVGGSSGIGLGIARYLLESGANVCIVSRSADRLETAAKDLGHSDRLQTAVADVTDERQVQELFSRIEPFDHLVATAAQGYSLQPINSLEVEAVRPFIESKLIGALLLAKHAPAHMREGGSITYTGGIAADKPAPGGSVVAAVNASFVGLTNALALELAPIRVNTIAPGWVDTPIWDTIAGPRKQGMLEQMAQRLPARRLTESMDVGHAVLFVATSRVMSGAVLHVDAGQRII